MSRHSAPGKDGAFGDDAWLPSGSSGEPADDATTGRRQRARHAADPQYLLGEPAPTPLSDDSRTGPPWEQTGWDDTGRSLPVPDPASMAGRHPSEPLPSLPPPPLREGDWAEAPHAFEYAGEAGHEPGYHGAGYPGDDADTGGGYFGDRPDDTGYGYAGYPGSGYDPGTYPEAGYHAGYDDTGTGFPVTNGGFPEGTGGYPAVTGGFPAVPGDFTDTGTGYAVPAYADGRFTDGGGRYPDEGDYPAGDEYLRYDEPTGGPDEHGYPDHEGWFEDTGVPAAGRRVRTAVSCPAWAAPRTPPATTPVSAERTGATGAAGARAPASRAPAGQDPAGQGRANRARANRARANRAGQGAASARAAFAGGRHGWL